ncbi:phosphonate metabolism protein PhnP [Gynuella sp.]|uniref:phosphonate metabolism protein PhnP n=1 Tax=Gynuella sp. TaxID=2969146 RepID=UPI003D0B60BB
MKLTFLGTGDSQQVPVYGCECKACQRARLISSYIRRPACALIQHENNMVLLDAGLTDLGQRFSPGDLNAILLTHFDMDHIQGLFHLRRGMNDIIPVYCPSDPQSPNALIAEPGILDFQPSIESFKVFQAGILNITPLPLQHNRPTYGYCVESPAHRIAYLTDTRGLPEQSQKFLQQWQPEVLVIDCTHPPGVASHQHHNDFDEVIEIVREVKPETTYLTHISHTMDLFLIEHFKRLPMHIHVAVDQLTIRLENLSGNLRSKLGT